MGDQDNQPENGTKPPAAPSGEQPPAKSPEELKKEEHLANLDKAIAEGTEELRAK